jgi:hypothetical protein
MNKARGLLIGLGNCGGQRLYEWDGDVAGRHSGLA